CNLVPFFWSQHYDVAVQYVGHAEAWDEIRVEGDIDRRDCKVSYRNAGRTLAVATIGRPLENLQVEAELERA
ncbi:MAG TPA: oxidoreductase C-terminal domain-containing protein, partial [Polyangiaceae bacterium]|nr:oxidoreductase C-terminal domain-containing protein [Polyangiaceae bacterium]